MQALFDGSKAAMGSRVLCVQVLNGGKAPGFSAESLAGGVSTALGSFARSSGFMQQPIFNSYHW
jgi:hypothetical protein